MKRLILFVCISVGLTSNLAHAESPCAAVLKETKIQQSDSVDMKMAYLYSINNQEELDSAMNAGLAAVIKDVPVSGQFSDFKNYRSNKSEQLNITFSDKEAHSYTAQHLTDSEIDAWLKCMTNGDYGLSLKVSSVNDSSAQLNLVFMPPKQWTKQTSLKLYPLNVNGGKLTSNKMPAQLNDKPLNIPLIFSRDPHVSLTVTMTVPPEIIPDGGQPTISIQVPPDYILGTRTECKASLVDGKEVGRFAGIVVGGSWILPCTHLKPGSNAIVSLSNSVFQIDSGLGYWLALDLIVNGQPTRMTSRPGGAVEHCCPYDTTADRRFPLATQIGPVTVPWDGQMYVTLKNAYSSVLPGLSTSATALSGEVSIRVPQ